MSEQVFPEPPPKSIADIIASVPSAIFTDTFPLKFFKISDNVASLVPQDYVAMPGELVFSVANDDGWISITKLYPPE